MAWQTQTADGYQFGAGNRIRITFGFSGILLFEDVRTVITERTPVQAVEVERNLMLIPTGITGVLKQPATLGEIKAAVEQALNEWSTYSVSVFSIESGVFIPGDVTTQQAVSLASIAAILLVCAAAFIYFRKGTL